MMCCATHEVKVCSPEPGTFKSFACNNFNFSAFEIVVHLVLPFLLHVIFKPSSSSQPQHIVICQVAGLHQLLHLPECQVHRHYFVSGIIVLLSCKLNSCNALIMPCYHVTCTCIRPRPKPLQCK